MKPIRTLRGAPWYESPGADVWWRAAHCPALVLWAYAHLPRPKLDETATDVVRSVDRRVRGFTPPRGFPTTTYGRPGACVPLRGNAYVVLLGDTYEDLP